jgi:hypothetical protein
MRDLSLAVSLACHRARQEGVTMIVWLNPRDSGFGRFAVRPADGVMPRTYDDRGGRVQWIVVKTIEPGEPATTPPRVLTPDRDGRARIIQAEPPGGGSR